MSWRLNLDLDSGRQSSLGASLPAELSSPLNVGAQRRRRGFESGLGSTLPSPLHGGGAAAGAERGFSPAGSGQFSSLLGTESPASPESLAKAMVDVLREVASTKEDLRDGRLADQAPSFERRNGYRDLGDPGARMAELEDAYGVRNSKGGRLGPPPQALSISPAWEPVTTLRRRGDYGGAGAGDSGVKRGDIEQELAEAERQATLSDARRRELASQNRLLGRQHHSDLQRITELERQLEDAQGAATSLSAYYGGGSPARLREAELECERELARAEQERARLGRRCESVLTELEVSKHECSALLRAQQQADQERGQVLRELMELVQDEDDEADVDAGGLKGRGFKEQFHELRTCLRGQRDARETELKNLRSNLRSVRTELRGRTTGQDAQQSPKSSQGQGLEQLCQTLQSEHKDMLSELFALDQQRSTYRSEAAAAELELDRVASDANSKQHSFNGQVQELLEKVTTSELEHDEARQTVSRLRDELSATRLHLELARDAESAVEERFAERLAQVDPAEALLAELQGELDEANLAVQSFRGQEDLRAQNEQLSQKVSDLDHVKSSLWHQQIALTTKCSTVERELAAAHRHCEELRHERVQAAGDAHRLGADLAEARAHGESLEARLADERAASLGRGFGPDASPQDGAVGVPELASSLRACLGGAAAVPHERALALGLDMERQLLAALRHASDAESGLVAQLRGLSSHFEKLQDEALRAPPALTSHPANFANEAEPVFGLGSFQRESYFRERNEREATPPPTAPRTATPAEARQALANSMSLRIAAMESKITSALTPRGGEQMHAPQALGTAQKGRSVSVPATSKKEHTRRGGAADATIDLYNASSRSKVLPSLCGKVLAQDDDELDATVRLSDDDELRGPTMAAFFDDSEPTPKSGQRIAPVVGLALGSLFADAQRTATSFDGSLATLRLGDAGAQGGASSRGSSSPRERVLVVEPEAVAKLDGLLCELALAAEERGSRLRSDLAANGRDRAALKAQVEGLEAVLKEPPVQINLKKAHPIVAMMDNHRERRDAAMRRASSVPAEPRWGSDDSDLQGSMPVEPRNHSGTEGPDDVQLQRRVAHSEADARKVRQVAQGLLEEVSKVLADEGSQLREKLPELSTCSGPLLDSLRLLEQMLAQGPFAEGLGEGDEPAEGGVMGNAGPFGRWLGQKLLEALQAEVRYKSRIEELELTQANLRAQTLVRAALHSEPS